MKKKKLIIIIIFILISIVIYFRNIIGTCIVQTETINQPELSAMFKSSFIPDKTTEVISNKGNKYIIPLPRGAAMYKSKNQYIVPADTLNIFYTYDGVILRNGWLKDIQLGALTKFKDSNGRTLNIMIEPFSSFYRKISFSVNE